MRLSIEIWKGGRDGERRVGEIWTNGRTVFHAPDEPVLRRIVEEEIVDYLGGDVTKTVTKSDPVKFVRNLPYRYKSQYMWATEAVEG